MDPVLGEPRREGLLLDAEQLVPALSRMLDGEPRGGGRPVREPRLDHLLRGPVQELRQRFGKLGEPLPVRLQAPAKGQRTGVAAVHAEEAVRVHPGVAQQPGGLLGHREDPAPGLDGLLRRLHGKVPGDFEQRDQHRIQPLHLVEERAVSLARSASTASESGAGYSLARSQLTPCTARPFPASAIIARPTCPRSSPAPRHPTALAPLAKPRFEPARGQQRLILPQLA